MGKGFKLPKDAQKMAAQVARMQEELAQQTAQATAGGGMVTAVANGQGRVVSLTIKPEVVDPGDVEMLQDLILAAVNEAVAKAQQRIQEEMSKMMGSFGLPGGLF